jgi:hypothetical protein
MNTIELHLITNCMKSSPSTSFIEHTYRSFCDTFGTIPPVVWCDSHPHTERFAAYCQAMLDAGFTDIRVSEGLSFSYINAIRSCRADFLFILEHDWSFVKENIRHTLAEILDVMAARGLYHMRFNKRKTIVTSWDNTLTEYDYNGLKYCVTPGISSNPHILQTRLAMRTIVPMVDIKRKYSAERQMTDQPHLVGEIYGPKDHPATIHHMDAREDEMDEIMRKRMGATARMRKPATDPAVIARRDRYRKIVREKRIEKTEYVKKGGRFRMNVPAGFHKNFVGNNP